jgi:hypothetical protein
MWPSDFDQVFQDVAARRCAECHQPDDKGLPTVPRKWYLRVERPENNRFMLAPLAKEAGGIESCGRAVFESTGDADYQALLTVFKPIEELLARQPRLDLYGEPVSGCRTGCADSACGSNTD